MIKFPNPTPAQTLLLHTLEGLLGSALLAGFTAGGQDIWTGNVDPKTVITVGIAAFFASFLKGYTTAVKPADVSQAVLDSVGEVRDMLLSLATPQPAQTVVVAQQTARPEPQPIQLPAVTSPNLNQPMQWGIQTVQNPQAIPVVNPQPTAPTGVVQTVQPAPALQYADVQRHFGDTGIVPVPSTGQGS